MGTFDNLISDPPNFASVLAAAFMKGYNIE